MSVLVRIGKHKAILRGAEWRSASKNLEDDLNLFTRQWIQLEADSMDLAGNIEHVVALTVAERYGGKVLLKVDARLETTQKRYFPLRQFNLFD